MSISVFIIRPPVPIGPSKLLCPVNARMSMLSSFISIFIAPALCAASTKNTILFSLAILPISFTGCIVPSTFDACVNTINAVSFLMYFLISSGFVIPSFEHSTVSIFIFISFSKVFRHLQTALCSKLLVITWSFSFSIPLIAIFKESVTLLVNTTFLGSSKLKRFPISFLHS